MSVKKPTLKLLNALTDTDKAALDGIYHHRCLNETLLYEFFYKADTIAREHAARRIRWMLQKGLIEPVEYGADFPALFLTMYGIETYRIAHNLPQEYYDLEDERLRRAVRKASDLKMKPNNLNHQMELNRFSLMFEARAKDQIAYSYKDEKFLDMYTIMRPDGMIQLNTAELFLEMDMGTERRDVLSSKWNHYREYLQSKDYRYRDKRIIMLFIINNVKMVEERRRTVLSTLQTGLLDVLDSCFEVYVDMPENLMDLIFNRLLPTSTVFAGRFANLTNQLLQMHQFIFSSSAFMDQVIPFIEFSAYIRKLNANKKILVQDGRPQEFLIDVYWDRPISVLKKIAFYQQTAGAMYRKLKRVIPYLVVVPNEQQFFLDLKVSQGVAIEHVYFTTEERLRGSSFPAAIFQYDPEGNLFHFADHGLHERVFERKVF